MSNTITATDCWGATCTPDFPCEPCVRDWLAANRPEALNTPLWNTGGALYRGTPVNSDPEPPTGGTGTGGGSTTRTGPNGRPATERQIAFLTTLCERTGTPVPTGLNTREASEMIDALKAQVDRTDTGELTGRWTKVNGEWAIRTTRPASVGDVITVVKANGERIQVRLGGEVNRDATLFDGRTSQRVDTPATGEDDTTGGLDLRRLFDGLLTSTGEQVTDLWVADPTSDGRLKLHVSAPRSGKWEGFVFVKDAAVYGEGRRYGTQRPGGTYRGQVTDALEAILADRVGAMARYGQLVGRCGRCGRTLEDEHSIERGLGPWCAAHM